MRKNKKAIIYCRVSDKKQKLNGNGLDSQQHRCRQYADVHAYEVVGVYAEDITGAGCYEKRDEMMALLCHIASSPNDSFVVIVDDVKRLAREAVTFVQLSEKIRELGSRIESPNFIFDSSPEGRFSQLIIAGGAQLEREQNQRQVIQKMKAGMEAGNWMLGAPKGYRYEKKPRQRSVMVPIRSITNVIVEAFELFTCGQMQTCAEVARFLERNPDFPRGKSGRVSIQAAKNMLTQLLYTGYMEYEPWGISLRPATHEGIISMETYLKAQERLAGNAHAPARKDISAQFPLRGFVVCECGHPMTAGFTKGRNKHYPYYYCQNRECEHRGKSIKRDVLEGEFEELLNGMTPRQEMFLMARDMFRDIWVALEAREVGKGEALEGEMRLLDKKIDQALDRVLDAESPRVIAAFEKRIHEMETRKIILEERIASCGRPVRDFETSYRTALDFLSNPKKLWQSNKLEDKRTVLKLAFTERLTYRRGSGYRTAEMASPFAVLAGISGGGALPESKVVGPPGLEPGTNGL